MANENIKNQQGQNRDQLNSGKTQQGQVGNKQFSTDTAGKQANVQSGQTQKEVIKSPGRNS